MIYTLFWLWSLSFLDGLYSKSLSYLVPIIGIILMFVPCADFPFVQPPYGIELIYNFISLELGSFLIILTSIIFGFLLWRRQGQNLSLIIILTGIVQSVITKDLFNLYVGFEIILFGLVGFGLTEGWQKMGRYLELNLISSSIILLGIIKVYSLTTSLEINSETGNLILLIGLMMKSGMWPGHKILELYGPNLKLSTLIVFYLISKVYIYNTVRIFSLTTIHYWLIGLSLLGGYLYLFNKHKDTEAILLEALLLLENASAYLVYATDNQLIKIIYTFYNLIIFLLLRNPQTNYWTILLTNFPIINLNLIIKVYIFQSIPDPFFSIFYLGISTLIPLQIFKLQVLSSQRSINIISKFENRYVS